MSRGTSSWTPGHGGPEHCRLPLLYEGCPVSIRVETEDGVAVATKLVYGALGNPDGEVPDDAVLICAEHGPQRAARHYRQHAEEYNARFDREHPPGVPL